MKQTYVNAKSIRQDKSLLKLLSGCKEDFEVGSTLAVPYQRLIRGERGILKECLEDSIPLSVFEHQVAIPLKLKPGSKFRENASYFIAPISECGKSPYGGGNYLKPSGTGWAIYELRERVLKNPEGENGNGKDR